METPLMQWSSPEYVEHPFTFQLTGINVYSLEEFYYHCFHYFGQSVEDVLHGNMVEWVRKELKMPLSAKKIEETLRADATETEKFITVLSMVEYFDPEELKELENKVYAWENKERWQQLKQRGDHAFRLKDYYLALVLYLESAQYNLDGKLLNNIGLCYKALGENEKGKSFFQKALDQEEENSDICINYLDFLLDIEDEILLLELKKYKSRLTDGQYYYYMAHLAPTAAEAAKLYELSVACGEEERSLPKLCALYTAAREPDKALACIEPLKQTDMTRYYWLRAQVKEASGQLKDAVRTMENIVYKSDGATQEHWVYYARLCRLHKDYNKGFVAVQKALHLQKDDPEALLEQALLYKAQEKQPLYKNALKEILFGWKSKYRKV